LFAESLYEADRQSSAHLPAKTKTFRVMKPKNVEGYPESLISLKLPVVAALSVATERTWRLWFFTTQTQTPRISN
jgi:hypothetical protein